MCLDVLTPYPQGAGGKRRLRGAGGWGYEFGAVSCALVVVMTILVTAKRAGGEPTVFYSQVGGIFLKMSQLPCPASSWSLWIRPPPLFLWVRGRVRDFLVVQIFLHYFGIVFA